MPCQKLSTAALRRAMSQLLAHDMYNPDEDLHLSGVVFFCATDERTRVLVEQIELLACEAFFDAKGRAVADRMRALTVDGVRIKLKHCVEGDQTMIRIAVPGRGFITISATRL